MPANLPWQEADLAIQHPRSQWATWGVRAAHGTLPPDKTPASMILPMGRHGPAFLAYRNFQVFPRLEFVARLFDHCRLSRDADRRRAKLDRQHDPHEAGSTCGPSVEIGRQPFCADSLAQAAAMSETTIAKC